jgi:hypothetical protein
MSRATGVSLKRRRFLKLLTSNRPGQPHGREQMKAACFPARIETDNNSVERTIRPISLNRKNALSAHDAGAEIWATIASLIETCKLNAVAPLAHLSATLTAIVNGHTQSKINELMTWKYAVRKSSKNTRHSN